MAREEVARRERRLRSRSRRMSLWRDRMVTARGGVGIRNRLRAAGGAFTAVSTASSPSSIRPSCISSGRRTNNKSRIRLEVTRARSSTSPKESCRRSGAASPACRTSRLRAMRPPISGTDGCRRPLCAGDAGDMTEVVVDLAAQVLARSAPKRLASGRPATVLARRRVVADAREALVENPRTGIIELARRVAVSPHHLSRLFKSETGETISRYRNRLRVRLALERLAEGEPSLARLAADIGFADQAHLARVVRRELGATPSLLRERLAPSEVRRPSGLGPADAVPM